jgi:carboxyl-terminal processing protease
MDKTNLSYEAQNGETEVISIPKKLTTSKNDNLLYIVVIVILFAVTMLVVFQNFKNTRIPTSINEFLSVTSQPDQKSMILDILEKRYIGDLPSQEKMTQGELEGLVASVGDKYTTYFSCEEYKAFQDDLNQNFDGIGARFKQIDDYVSVEDVILNSPAAQIGLQKGDILVAVDGQLTDDLSFSKIIEKIRGKANTFVRLDIDRPNQIMIDSSTTYNRLSFNIERKSIHVDAVVLEDRGEIAWVKVSTFSREVDAQMSQIASQIKQNPNFKYIVLDLRDNGGGLFDQAVQLSSYFLEPETVVVQEKDKQGTREKTSVFKPNNLTAYPVMVAINQGSASASEIVAGALQDNGAAKVIGKTSYGKGVVQEIADLTGCDKIKLTIAEWFTPNGNTINNTGITPDIKITRGQDYEAVVRANFGR